VLQCPVCQATMLLLAVITRREVIDRILTHVKVRREPVLSLRSADGVSVVLGPAHGRGERALDGSSPA